MWDLAKEGGKRVGSTSRRKASIDEIAEAFSPDALETIPILDSDFQTTAIQSFFYFEEMSGIRKSRRRVGEKKQMYEYHAS